MWNLQVFINMGYYIGQNFFWIDDIMVSLWIYIC